MYKMLLISVAQLGKGSRAWAYQEKKQRIYDRLGIPRKAWRIEGRKVGQVLVEYGPFESREGFDAAQAKITEDEEWQALNREQNAAEVVVPGSQEVFLLTV